MKKSVALLLAVMMLLAMPLLVSAETAVIDPEVKNSISINEETQARRLAFLYNVNATGVAVNGKNEFLNNNAKVQYNGAEAKLVAMGAIVTNQEQYNTTIGETPLTRELAETEKGKVLDIEARYLYTVKEASCTFAVRITNIGKAHEKRAIYARPYFVVEVDGVQETVYGEISQKTYFSAWCDTQPAVVLPEVGDGKKTDIDVAKKKGRIFVSAASIVDRTVTLTFKNYTTNWITEETDWVEYTAYDADGNTLKTDKIYIGVIDTKKNKTKTFTFDVPDNTAEVKLTNSKIIYWTEWS